MKIVVLSGGLSTERNVALTSGAGICRALRRRGHRAVLVDMFLGLENYSGEIENIFDAPDGLCADHSVSSAAPDLEAVRRSRRDQSPSMLGQGVLQACALADLVFLALHGSCGEDGRIQATLDLLGVPYTGSGYLGSGMAMDKALTKQVMERSGVRTAPWHNIYYTEADIPRLVEELEVPCAVKIVNGGSSVGVSLPETKEELAAAPLSLARERLSDVLRSYRAMRDCELVLVFDGYRVAGNTGERETRGIRTVYTKENETADMYIERLANDIGKNYSVKVVTNDSLIRLSAMRSGVLRMSVKEFSDELDGVMKRIMEYIDGKR